MRVARLSIKNFLGIKEAVIEPKEITILAGKNKQGKSSVLKAIQAVFKGAPFSVIHQGTDRAELIADLEDIRVTRVITKKTASVVVKTKEGFTRPAPQTYLDGLLGSFAFNPLGFLLAEPKDQRDYLLKAMGSNVTREKIIEAAGGAEVPVPSEGPALTQYADAHRWFYQQRTEVNRRIRQKQGAAEELKKGLPAGFKLQNKKDDRRPALLERHHAVRSNIFKLEAEKEIAEKAVASRGRTEREIGELQKRADTSREAMKRITYTDPDAIKARDLVNKLREELQNAVKNHDHIVSEMQRRQGLQKEVEAIEDRIAHATRHLKELPPPFDPRGLEAEKDSLAEVSRAIEELDANAAHEDAAKELSGLQADIDVLGEESQGLSVLIERFGKELPLKAVEESNLPVQGLAVEGGAVLVNGVPMENLSTSEQIGVTLAIARAMSKEIPLICIDGVERLDDETFAEFVRQAEGDGFQYFVTRVGSPKEGEIAVHEGTVG